MLYKAFDIKYDTDGQKVDLPDPLEIDVPDDITDTDEVEEHIADEISNRTGWCHDGFSYEKVK